MTNESDNPRVVIGGNNPPFDEVLADEQKDYADRVKKLGDELALIAEVKDDDTLEKAIEGVKRCTKSLTKVEDDRKLRNVEFNEKIETVNKFFRKLAETPATHKTRLIGLIDGHNARKEEEARAIAAAAAERAAEEARIRQESAAEAGGVVGEALKVDAEKKEHQAESARRAATDRDAGPVRTASGTAGKRREIKFTVKAADKIPLAKLKGHFDLAALEKAIRSYTKAKTKASDDLPELAGVEFFYETKTVIR